MTHTFGEIRGYKRLQMEAPRSHHPFASVTHQSHTLDRALSIVRSQSYIVVSHPRQSQPITVPLLQSLTIRSHSMSFATQCALIEICVHIDVGVGSDGPDSNGSS